MRTMRIVVIRLELNRTRKPQFNEIANPAGKINVAEVKCVKSPCAETMETRDVDSMEGGKWMRR
jgi:hypothetical protein